MSSRFSAVHIRHFLFAPTAKTAIDRAPMLRSG
jgi:hypothetical protein